ncbi:Pentatricopeptide repeat-containing protein [Apostasia shenzhenica]|uniref:Pentatricopeptide repeat-containing protein n=1 Tax=Apostasia shenzhenica TaxID=1088818 RepID=A0A2I0AMI0_9ASPA|nr:Pentatricopeptide repeat-containing protein [Apostasia shenzhenica]
MAAAALIPLPSAVASTGGAANPNLPRFSDSLRTPFPIVSPPASTAAAFRPLHPSHLLPHLSIDHPDHLRSLLRLAWEHRDLALGQSLHAAIVKSGDHRDQTRLVNSVITAYLKLGQLSDACQVLDEMPFPDVASFTSIVSHYAKMGMESEAARLFNRMRQTGIEPNEYTLVAVATNCIRQANFHLGSQLHALACKTNHSSCTHVSNALMGMYVKCAHVGSALEMFDRMPERDVSSWNAVVLGLIEDGRHTEALELFRKMIAYGEHGDKFSLSTLLRAAADGFDGEEGELIHTHALKIGLDLDLSVGNALLHFYTRFGQIEDVVNVFDGMPVKDVISWTGMLAGYMEFGLVESAVDLFDKMPERNHISYNALLAGFCKNGHGSKGLELFQEILEDELELSDFTVTSVVKACALMSDRKKSEQIHGFIIKSGCELSDLINSALVDMCAKCSRLEDGRRIFESRSSLESSLITWTSLIHAYAENGQPEEALSLFHRMLEREDLIMDEFALANILGVSGTLGFCLMGRQVKGIAIKAGFLSDIGVSNAIVSMYAKCGFLEDALLSFSQMLRHDIISWNTLINAYLLFRLGDKALEAWKEMEIRGMEPDALSFSLIISACKHTSSNSVETCERLFHSMSDFHDIKAAPEHYAVMVDVLGHWGCSDKAEKLISTMPFEPDATVWRAMLDGCRTKADSRLGRKVVRSILALEPHDPSTYILIANLFSASGRWHCSEKVREEMRARGVRKNPARSWTVGRNSVNSFFCRDKSHPECKDISAALEVLIVECMRAGYEPDTSFVLHEVEEYQKRDFLFYHSAKLAATYGILMAGGSREAVRVVKNIRLCGDCHEFLKFASFVAGREIWVRDSTGFHCLKERKCSCGDHW